METLYIVAKVFVSILFFSISIVLIYLTVNSAKYLRKLRKLEQELNTQIKQLQGLGSTVLKTIVEICIMKQAHVPFWLGLLKLTPFNKFFR